MSSLTSYLAKKGAVDPAALQKVLLNQAIKGGGIGVNLLEAEAIEEELLVRLSARFHRLPEMDVHQCLAADASVVTSIPEHLCVGLSVVPVRRENDQLVVACLEPLTRSDLASLQRSAGCRVKLVITSPLVVPLLISVHHDVPLDARIAQILRSRGLAALRLDELDPRVAGRIQGLLHRHLAAPERSSDEEEPSSDDWDDLDDSEDIEDASEEDAQDGEQRDSVVGKYIIINRIGTRRRKPSIAMRPEPRVEPPASHSPGPAPEPIPEPEPAPEPEPPGRRSSAPPPPRRSSVPPAVLKEVVEEYLEGDLSSPPPVKAPQVQEEQAHQEPSPSGEGLRADRTIAVGEASAGDTRFVEKHVQADGSGAGPAQKRTRRPAMKTLPGVRLQDLAEGEATLQGYSVEVPELVSLPEVLQAIEGASRAAEIIDVLHRYALQFFDLVMVLMYKRGRFEVTALSSRGWAWPVNQLPDRFMGYDQLPDTIQKLGQPHLGPVEPEGKIAGFLQTIGRPVPPRAILMPVTLKGRAIVVIYGDNGNKPVAFDEAHDLFHATWVATNSLMDLLKQSR